ncbi:hypothetical protein [Hymenobacter fodinae]|uniref:Uncharacterized protein n=1 Tax=Hymenobacter fodinae TaxID=2510796 RepID=A0A4Z0NYT2_9BACT|nr:hypothetical protein [Hymenobacter fodinae]TGE03326.1 hypothetical protein EU556_25765 [Hymenobacter fodinae]
MNTATLIESGARISKRDALLIASYTLKEMHLKHDVECGFVATLDRKHDTSPLIWTVAYHTEQNPFGFAQEKNYIEINAETGDLIAILTPRGDLVKRQFEDTRIHAF